MIAVDYLLLCKEMTIDDEGLVSLTDIFNVVKTSGLPVVHTSFKVAFWITHDESDFSKDGAKVDIMVYGVNDERIVGVSGQVVPPEGHDASLPLRTANSIDLSNQIQFTEEGKHRVDLLLNDNVVASREFSVSLETIDES